MSLVIKLSPAERIINALSRVAHKRTDDVITRNKREAEAIRSIISEIETDAKQDYEALCLAARRALLNVDQWHQLAKLVLYPDELECLGLSEDE